MNLKKLAVGAAIAASVVGGSVAATAPAEAAVFNFTTSARLKNAGVAIGGNSQLDFITLPSTYTGTFASTTLGNGTGRVDFPTYSDFANLGETFTLKDLSLKRIGTNAWELATTPIANFISGLSTGVTFRLDTFGLTRSGNLFTANYTGYFSNFPDGIGTGFFTTQGIAASDGRGSSFSSDINVPTPALLPALLGMGAAALRKRKGEAAELGQETVKA
jgi:hypothetical protein